MRTNVISQENQLVSPTAVCFYLDSAECLGFLDEWHISDNQLTLTFYEGTRKGLDLFSPETIEYLVYQVEFFYDATSFESSPPEALRVD